MSVNNRSLAGLVFAFSIATQTLVCSEAFAQQPSGSGVGTVNGAAAPLQRILYWHTGVAGRTYSVEYEELVFRGAGQGWVPTGNKIIQNMPQINVGGKYYRHEATVDYNRFSVWRYRIQDTTAGAGNPWVFPLPAGSTNSFSVP
jgi:hypothetical protein